MTTTTLEKLVGDFERRQALLRSDRHIHTMDMKAAPAEEVLFFCFGMIIHGIEQYQSLVAISVKLGRSLQQKYGWARDAIAACQQGWFVLVSYIEAGILGFRRKHQAKKKKNANPSYMLEIADQGAIDSLWGLIKTRQVEMFPKAVPPRDWVSGYHPLGFPIVKKGEKDVLAQFSPEKQPMVFKALNKLGAQPWLINKSLLEVAEYYLQNPELPSPINLEGELDQRRKTSKEIETNSTLKLARHYADASFYHLYNCDFRGRIYNNTSYLNEMGTDLSKAMLLLTQGDRLGDNGLYWLYVHIANCLGQDKLPLDDRAQYVEDHFDELLGYATDPTVNTGWHNSDKPWSTLAGCFELWLVSQHDGPPEDYVCHLPTYIDGTVSGTQHLVALSRDTELAGLVNLVPSERPGDLYSYVARLVWTRLGQQEAELDQGTLIRFDEVLAQQEQLERNYLTADYRSQAKADAWQELAEWKNHNRAIREALFPVFWNRVTSLKERRKIAKRNTMTLGYGLTRYGASQQIIDDSPDVSEYIASGERLWYAKLGAEIFDTCREELKGPSRMLGLFETLADRANERSEYMTWVTSVTGFIVAQRYKKPEIKRTKLRFADQEIKVTLESWLDATLNSSAQRAAASPNIIHSLDAAHLTSVVASVEYPIAVIHDSFGCTPGNMNHMFYHVRQKFVELYKTDPLRGILTQFGALDLMPEIGTLDIEEVMLSDFAFS
jgi:DNA-directed RNA polymerase